jgi:sulfate transporter 4
MFGAASNQLGPHWSETADGVNDVSDDMETGEHVKISALAEEKARLATQILQARHAQVRKPVQEVRRKLACHESGPDEGSAQLVRTQLTARQMVAQRLPFITWLSELCCASFRADVIAGVTVGVMAIPQSMSYATIAGLPYVYGLYSACVPTLVYAFFGQSRQLAVGPVAMVSLLIEAGLRGQLSEDECPAWYARSGADEMKAQYEFCPEEYAQLAILTAMVVGVIQLLACFLRLGFIVSFLGHAVISGFTSGAAIIIGLSQAKYMFGFDIAKSEVVYETVWNIASKIDQTKPMTVALGVFWFLCLFANKKLSQKYKQLSTLGALGPLISCVVGICLVWWCPPLRDEFDVAYVGEIKQGLFPVSISQWNFANLQKVLPTAITACFIGYMESIAISKNLAAKHGYDVDAGQELLALGMANLVGSMFSSYPVTGSFSRSAVNNATGAVSQCSGLVTGVLMFCVMMFMTPLFYYLPKFVLAAIVINSVLALVAFGEARRLFKVKKNDFLLWIVAFLGTLFTGVLRGIIIAVSLSLCIVIYESVRPQIAILWRIPGTTIYRNVKQESRGSFVPNIFIARIGSSMYFANASFIKDMLLTYIEDLAEVNKTEYIVLEMTAVVSIDSSALHCVQDIVHHFRSQGIQVCFAMVGNRVEKTMRKAEFTSFVGDEWFFPTVDAAVKHCVQHQQAKRKSQDSVKQTEGGDDILVNQNDAPILQSMHLQNTLAISNVSDRKATAVSFSRQSVGGGRHAIIAEVLSVFHDLNALATQTCVEVSSEGVEKHFYLVQDAISHGKLIDATIESLHQALSALLGQTNQVAPAGEKQDALSWVAPEDEKQAMPPPPISVATCASASSSNRE